MGEPSPCIRTDFSEWLQWAWAHAHDVAVLLRLTQEESLFQGRTFCFWFFTYINCKSFFIQQNENKG